MALRLAGARFFAGALPLDERVALPLFRAAVDRLLERFAALLCFVLAMSPYLSFRSFAVFVLPTRHSGYPW